MSEPVAVSADAARRFLVRAFALDGSPSLPDVPAVLEALEFVQEDSINICGRIHDLILRNRIPSYSPVMLHDTLYSAKRAAFEYYFPNLCALPLRDYPYFRRTMLSVRTPPGRWRGLTPEEETVAAALFAQMDADGPLRSRLTGKEHGHATSGWGTRAKVASLVLDKLWYQGHLTIARRENFERWFDRAHRHFDEWERDLSDLPDETEEARYKMRKRLRAKRLFRLPRGAASTLGKYAFLPKGGTETLGDSALLPVRLEGDSRLWHILAEDADLLLSSATPDSRPPTAALLAPLDPVIYDRERNRRVFGFDYIWEVYTPEAKRKWGYYVLPILFGDRIVGRVDPKIDRAKKTLTLNSVTLEPGDEAAEVGPAIGEAIREFAAFLGATTINPAKIEPKALKKYLP